MLQKRLAFGLLVVIVFVFCAEIVSGREGRVQQIPNGSVNFCLNCHFNIPEPGKSSERNSFGLQVEELVPPDVLVEFWSPDLAAKDADQDGYSNGLELLDPEGTWKQGDPNPGDPILIGNPGVFESTPLATYTATETPTPQATETPTETATSVPTETATETPTPVVDLNGDGIVDKADLSIFLNNWHQTQ